jgi:hypothetical protein
MTGNPLNVINLAAHGGASPGGTAGAVGQDQGPYLRR